jgi:MOSC domain-containing protein YiiM
MSARIVSVNVGQPQTVSWKGQTFTTAIIKHPSNVALPVRGVNVEGDDQADRTVHGGRSKAVYAYALEDYEWWKNGAVEPKPGLFGENLTTQGVDLSNCRIGERWQVGTTVLEVSEPRIPCYKLGFRLGDATFPAQFARALRPGTYFRIIEEGAIGPGDSMRLLFRPNDHDITSREVMRIRLFAHEERVKLGHVSALSLAYRGWAMLDPEQLGT